MVKQNKNLFFLIVLLCGLINNIFGQSDAHLHDIAKKTMLEVFKHQKCDFYVISIPAESPA